MRAPLGRVGKAGLSIAGLAALAAGVALAGGDALVAQTPPDSAARPGSPDGAQAVVIASKPFGESYLLMEVFAQALEARGIEVDRRPGLGATEIAFRALREGDIDVYPEYTGTGLVAILNEQPAADEDAVFDRVESEFRQRWGVRWLAPLGFQNTYAVAVRRETAERYGLRTLSDLARVSGELRAGFSPDFIGRSDGLEGLRPAYGFAFDDTRPLLQAVKYQALAEGAVDVIDGYSTDGQVARYDLVVLRDDRAFFPAYEAAPLVSRRLAETRPDALAALAALAGRLDEETMRRLNRRVEVDGEDLAAVAADVLATLRLGPAERRDSAAARPDRGDGLLAYLWSRRASLARQTRRHLLLVLVSLLAAVLVAVPLGLGLERARAGAEGVIRGVGMLQTIPSIALLAFMIPLLGIGVVPALVALFLYALYPIARNTYTGVRDAGPAAVAAGRALGMTPGQLLRQVRLPLAAPVIMAGVRTAAVISVGTATLAAFIGAGGLGDPIVAGLALSDTRMILSGAIPAAVLAFLVDLALAGVERLVRPGGIAPEAR
ncbi:MAG: glycine betaine ABC transporter substrate-binding protein [Gemmatimonadota bacterium]